MKPPSTLSGRIQLVVAGLAFLTGSSAAVFGATMTLFAMFTGRSDPRHGGAMILGGSVPLLIAGVLLLALAFIIWPRERRNGARGEPAA